MSRLDSFIRRMSAQRSILNALQTPIQATPGLIFEFGLGSGRTYDHLVSLFEGRRIVVIENDPRVAAQACPVPAECHVGDVRDVAAAFPDGCAALVHADIETGNAAIDAGLATWLPALVARLLGPGGYGVSGSALLDPALTPLTVVPGLDMDRYHVVRRADDTAVEQL